MVNAEGERENWPMLYIGELGLLFPENQVNHYKKKAIEAYMCIVDEDRFVEQFSSILELASTIRQEAFNMLEYIKRELEVKPFGKTC